MQHVYYPKGVCSRKMTLEMDGTKIDSVQIEGGCSGNIQALCRLVQGMEAAEAVERLDGIRCGFKSTSCPDQLSKAITEVMNQQ